MKRVLILAYDFPPYSSVGAQRPYGWFKYLKQCGWEPIVITRHWDANIKDPIDCIKPSHATRQETIETPEGIIIKAPYKPNLRDKIILSYGFNRFTFIRKVLTFFMSYANYLFPALDNMTFIYKTANKVLKEHPCDMIIATGEPFILLKYASVLSKTHKIPWVADYRDAWSTNYSRMWYEQLFFRFIEKKIVHSASALTTVLGSLKKELGRLHRQDIHVIRNGYFKEYFSQTKVMPKHKQFTIFYGGTIYSYYPLEEFIEGFVAFVKKHKVKDIEIIFLGINFFQEQKWRIKKAFKTYYRDYVKVTDRVDHLMALDIMSNADLLLILGDNNHPAIPVKTFDYLAVKRKILLFKDDEGEINDILTSTNSGVICSSKKALVYELEKLYFQWKTKGEIDVQSTNIEMYSREYSTYQLAHIFDSIIDVKAHT